MTDRTAHFTRLASLLVWLLAARGGNGYAQGTAVPFEAHPAVQVRWPASEGKQYQVYASSNLLNWTAAGLTTPGLSSNCTYSTAIDSHCSGFFKVTGLADALRNRFVGLEQVWWKPAELAKDTNGLTFTNLRLLSNDLTPADMITAHFAFDFTSQSFRLAEYDVITNLGVFDGLYFMADQTNKIYLCRDGQDPMPEAQYYTITVDGSEYYLDLSAGQLLCFYFYHPNDDFCFTMEDPDGKVLFRHIISSACIEDPLPVLRAGRYTVRFSPFGSAQTSLYFAFLNCNRRLLREVTNGSSISCNLASGFWDYAKYYADLQPDQVLSFSSTGFGSSGGAIQVTILNSYSELDLRAGSDFKFQPLTGGRYYMVIANNRSWGGSFTATVSIQQSSPPPPLAQPMARRAELH